MGIDKQLLDAIAKRDANAMNTLGELYRDGAGVKQNYVMAGEWFREAAAHGSPEAITNLSELATRNSIGNLTPEVYSQYRNMERWLYTHEMVICAKCEKIGHLVGFSCAHGDNKSNDNLLVIYRRLNIERGIVAILLTLLIYCEHFFDNTSGAALLPIIVPVGYGLGILLFNLKFFDYFRRGRMPEMLMRSFSFKKLLLESILLLVVIIGLAVGLIALFINKRSNQVPI